MFRSAASLLISVVLLTSTSAEQKAGNPGETTQAGDFAPHQNTSTVRPAAAAVSKRSSSGTESLRGNSDVGGMHNLLAVSTTVLSGSQPTGQDDFRALRTLGVRVIVSVDGSLPDVENARSAELQYVHIPVGYDGIEREEQLALARVLADTLADRSGAKIYFHCHHGKHRGPAAAATACRMNGLLDESGAAEFLNRAHTGREYTGLWETVRTCRPAAAGEVLPLLHESVAPPEVVAMMKSIETQFDAIRTLTAAPDCDAEKLRPLQAVLTQLFRETARLPDAADYSKELLSAAQSVDHGSNADQSSSAVAGWVHAVEQRCTGCHRRHRDTAAPRSAETHD